MHLFQGRPAPEEVFFLYAILKADLVKSSNSSLSICTLPLIKINRHC